MNTPLTADVITPRSAVLVQDRPVVPFGPWLASSLRDCNQSGRSLQIVTPVATRLSLPLRLVLAGEKSPWVVGSSEDGYYDGLSGAPLYWDGGAFSLVPGARDYAPGYLTRPSVPIGTHFTLTFRARYPPQELLGGAIERIHRSLFGRPPLGWGTAEPATNLWAPAEITSLCHQRWGNPTWVLVTGGESETGPEAVIGTVMYTPTAEGIEESVTLVAGYPEGMRPPIDALPAVIGEVAAEHRLLSLSAQFSPGRADLTTEPRWLGRPAPVGLAASRELGGGAPTPPDIPGYRIGEVWWYPLGNGLSVANWQRYEQLMRHLRPPV
jgi:Family of unknown function (DUF6177)